MTLEKCVGFGERREWHIRGEETPIRLEDSKEKEAFLEQK